MKVIEITEKIDKNNIGLHIMSDFDKKGNSIEIAADKIGWKKFKEWVIMKTKIKDCGENTLENRIRLLNEMIKAGRILYIGEPFEIEAKERVTEKAPQIIQDLFSYPYQWVKEMYLKGTFLDVGCGERNLGKELFGAIGVDIADNLKTDYIKVDVRKLPFLDKSFDYVTCFEVIEHIKKQEQVLNELIRVARKKIIIGSVNKNGPTYIEGVEIYKGKRNPFHLQELGISEFVSLITKIGSVMGVFYSIYENGIFQMKEGLSDNGFCLYAILKDERILKENGCKVLNIPDLVLT